MQSVTITECMRHSPDDHLWTSVPRLIARILASVRRYHRTKIGFPILQIQQNEEIAPKIGLPINRPRKLEREANHGNSRLNILSFWLGVELLR